MKEIKGTPLQALKYSMIIEKEDGPGEGHTFLELWSDGVPLTSYVVESDMSFVEFCLANPDEPEHKAADGTVRKAHYGDGKQPWDTMVEFGWAVEFAAANVLKYLRRDKELEASETKARWYFARLIEFTNDDSDTARRNDAMRVTGQLLRELAQPERDRLDLPSCFRPINA